MKKEIWIYRAIILALIGAFLLFNDFKCGNCKPEIIETVKIDTQYIQVKAKDIASKPVIKSTTKANKNKIPKASTNIDTLKSQYDSCAERYYATNYYEDSNIVIKDSSGKILGNVTIKDSVSENQIKDRKFDYKLDIPVVTKTITRTVLQQPKRQLYIGAELGGNKQTLINFGEAGLLYKTKKDQIYKISFGAQVIDQKVLTMYKIGTYIKLGGKNGT